MSQNGPLSELAKQRLTFVSANVVVLASLFLNLWPAFAAYQTGLHINVWTVNLPNEGVRPELTIFWFMTFVLAVTSCAIIFAIIHISSWGLWLSVSTGEANR